MSNNHSNQHNSFSSEDNYFSAFVFMTFLLITVFRRLFKSDDMLYSELYYFVTDLKSDYAKQKEKSLSLEADNIKLSSQIDELVEENNFLKNV